jgi:ADP-L-glycero-D-manno-heptose 6-epimerase
MFIVTGGAGFIGSNLVRGLNARGIDDILIVDDLEQGDKHRSLNSLEFRDFVDYREFGAEPRRFLGAAPEAIFHQGACSDTTEKNGRFMLGVNYEYSKTLLEYALGRCPFLYASSAAVYGDGDDGFVEEPRCEWPLNVYGFSKQLFDRHVRRVLGGARTQVVGLRYFNVYGPQENHKGRMASVVHKFHGQATTKGALEIFEGSEKFVRDFVFVDDVVAVNLHFLAHPGASGIFNCGSGAAESFRKLADETVKHYSGARIVEIPFPDDLRGKYQAYTRADLTRLRATGFTRPMTSLADGVAAYVRVLQESGGYYRRPATKPA